MRGLVRGGKHNPQAAAVFCTHANGRLFRRGKREKGLCMMTYSVFASFKSVPMLLLVDPAILMDKVYLI